MNLRTVYRSLGVVCIITLVIAGLALFAENAQKTPAKKQVYCDIDALVKSHPAWNQLVQVRVMLTRSSKADRYREESVESAHGSDMKWREPVAVSGARELLQSRLERKSQEELSKIRLQLNDSLERRLTERSQDLDAKVKAAEAEASREAEQELAQDLRTLNEENQFERLDAAIKLSALKAQLETDGLSRDEVKKAIDLRESELIDSWAKLAEGEDDLRLKIVSRAAQVGEDQRRSAEQELAAMRDDETRRINDIIRKKRDRLRQELESDGFGAIAKRSTAGDIISAIELVSDSSRTDSETVNKLKLNYTVDGAGDLVSFERSLGSRIRVELESVVKRIARENGLQVVFKNTGKVEDRTDWFRKRLPYLAKQVKDNDRN